MTLDSDVQTVYATLRDGGLALVPTDTGYGLVAIKEQAVRRIYVLKGRPATKPCVTVTTPAITERVAAPLPQAIVDWIEAITYTSPLAVVTKLADISRLRSSQSVFVREQTTTAGTIALFYSAGPLLERLAELARVDGMLVVGSSANLSGTGNNYRSDDVPDSMIDGADLVLDRGPTRFQSSEKLASTILDLTTGQFIRSGINFSHIAQSWRRLGATTGDRKARRESAPSIVDL
jgi:tRNA A37 threonylcarbamoyladenosine synthetase subunit TsaC/SUA5/YrdC